MSNRKKIPDNLKFRLFASAAGFCQNPACHEALFPQIMGGDKHIAEMAHVIPHGKKGPRHKDRPQEDYDPDTYENLILLCPTCHKKIDKAEALYPREELLSWKENHLNSLSLKKGIQHYEDRALTRRAIESLFAENKEIWDNYAPEDGRLFLYNPESESAQIWERRVKGIIIPNHYTIKSIIEKNLDHLIENENEIFAKYKEHIRGLVERHICEVPGSSIRYPNEMKDFLK